MLLHPSTAPDHGKKTNGNIRTAEKMAFCVLLKLMLLMFVHFCWSERVLSKHQQSDVSLAKFRQTPNESYQILIIIAETRLELKMRRVESFIGDGSESF